VKLSRFRRPKATCFLSYVEYIPYENTYINIMKNMSHKEEVTYKKGRVKEES
jgi:hypothetical protein